MKPRWVFDGDGVKRFHLQECSKDPRHDGDCLEPEFQQYQILVRSAGGPGKISVYVVEIDGAEWIKNKVLEKELRPKGVRSRLVKAYWIIAKAVYDGRTANSAGARARAAAASMLAMVRRQDPWLLKQGEYKYIERTPRIYGKKITQIFIDDLVTDEEEK